MRSGSTLPLLIHLCKKIKATLDGNQYCDVLKLIEIVPQQMCAVIKAKGGPEKY